MYIILLRARYTSREDVRNYVGMMCPCRVTQCGFVPNLEIGITKKYQGLPFGTHAWRHGKTISSTFVHEGFDWKVIYSWEYFFAMLMVDYRKPFSPKMRLFSFAFGVSKVLDKQEYLGVNPKAYTGSVTRLGDSWNDSSAVHHFIS